MDELLSMALPMVALVGIFYFMLIRPENKKKKAMEAMRSAMKVGDEVTSIGGIVGTVCAVKDNSIVVETGADRVRMEFMKWAIATVGADAAAQSK